MNRLLALAILSATVLPAAALAQSTDAPSEASANERPAEASGADAGEGATAPRAAREEIGVTSYLTEQPADALFATDLVGYDVYGSEGEKIGDINDVVIRGDGTVAGVVIGVGGFLGLGEKDVAVPLSDLELERVDGGNRIAIAATERELMEAPMFVRADGTTSDRIGAWERTFQRTREEAERALGVAGERAGELYDQAGEEAQRLIEQGREAVRGLTGGEETAPADGQPADGGGSQ